MTLLSAPLQLGGDWGGSAPGDALAVIARMREVSLSGVRLLSDRQPAKLRVDDHATGPPHIWLHDDNPDTAWIVVNIGARDWCKLAYQFGHELGHVVCNSWWRDARPRQPCQWLEEAMVEAFSLRGLSLLADSWERDIRRSPAMPRSAARSATTAATRSANTLQPAATSARGSAPAAPRSNMPAAST
jgi:hypothetical protein